MKWYHRSQHVDGVSYRLFATEGRAKADMAKAGPLEPTFGGQMIDSNGGSHSVDMVPSGIKTARGMAFFEEAYDARECDKLTPAQKAFLTRIGM